MKQVALIIILSFAFSMTGFAQYADINAAVTEINTLLASAPTKSSFTVDEKGETKKVDEHDVTYEFNLNDVEMVKYEKNGVSHLVKFICASGNKCFHSEDNLGGGVFHYLELDTEADAKKVVEAFMFIKQKIKMY